VTSESTKASRRFLVMNCFVSWVRTDRRARSARRRPAPGRSGAGRPGPRGSRGPFGVVGCDAETMMRELYSM
jgi:hypothetical protein